MRQAHLPAYVLDAGALLAVERGRHDLVSVLRGTQRLRRRAITSAAVVAQVWRGGARQAVLARVLSSVQIESLTPAVGHELGVLLARSGTRDVVDALIAWLTRPGDVVLTSDPDDLAALLAARGVGAAVRSV